MDISVFFAFAGFLAGLVTIVAAAWKISSQIGRLDARMDGIDRRIDTMQHELHSINEHLRPAR